MKSPDAALLRARAKAPLADLHVLHLSNADVACLRNLEGCRRLRSLYANSNILKEVDDGLTSLRSLWRIDLSDNRLGQLTGLASFRALGFLHLQRNRLSWDALVCLRDVHILDLRLSGNSNLLPKNADRDATVAYCMRIVALLPSVWTLDGHFVTASERAQAVEAYDDWVLELLARHRDAYGGGALRFGSTSDLWGGAQCMGDPDNNVSTIPVEQDVFKLLQVIEKQPIRNPDHQDLYRLRALASFHDSECDVHNAHAHFAPQKHSPTAKPMPKLRLRQLQTLPSRTQLELGVILAAHIEFPLPAKLLSEALTIAMLRDGDSDPASVAWVQDLVLLPAYGIVSVVSALRSQAMEAHAHALATSPSDDSIQLWRTVPVVLRTLLHTERHVQLVERSTPELFFLQRCAFVVALLSRAGAFPSNSASQASHRDLHILVSTAKLVPTVTHDETSFVIPTTVLSSSCEMPWKKANVAMPDREYRKPWKERHRLATTPSSPDIQTSTASQKRRAPKPGEWLQVRPKFFLKICAVSARGDTLTASPATANKLHNAMVTLSIDQVARVSNSMWRVASDDPHTLEEIKKLVNEAPTTANRRLGKLHRDSEGFHKHGASRNQGYPNHDVSSEDLQRVLRHEEDGSALCQPLPVEVFSATATLDANYVLTSPAMISVQNDVASRAFHAQRQPPAGLWNPIETASFSVALPLEPSKPTVAETTPAKSTKPKCKRLAHPPHSLEDDWLELRREMQMLLGIRPRSPSLPLADDSAGVKCFVASVEAAAEHGDRSADFPSDTEIASTLSAPSPTPGDDLLGVLLSSPIAPRSTARPRKLASLPWHQVTTKPQLLVAAASPIPPRSSNTSNNLTVTKTTAVALTSHAPTKEPDVAVAASVVRPSSTASRVPLRLMRCHVSLPTLSLVSPK